MKINTKQHDLLIDEVFETVFNILSSTLGPNGRYAIFAECKNDSMYDVSPVQETVIINDGITILNKIEFKSAEKNLVLNLIRDITRNTNTIIGDGTTSSVILAFYIWSGIRMLETFHARMNAIQQIKHVMPEIENIVFKMSFLPNIQQLEHVATSTSNSSVYGKLIADTIRRFGTNTYINIKRSVNDENYVEITTGFDVASTFFGKDLRTKQYINRPIVFVSQYDINDIQSVHDIISVVQHQIESENRNIILFAPNFSDEVLELLQINRIKSNIGVFGCRLDSIGQNMLNDIDDIAFICQLTPVLKSEYIDFKNLQTKNFGMCECVEILNYKMLRFNFNIDSIQKSRYVNAISCVDENDLKRVSQLQNGVATIYVAATSYTDFISKKMKIEDSINATCVAEKFGIVYGGGRILLDIKNELENKNIPIDSTVKKIVYNMLDSISTVLLSNSDMSEKQILDAMLRLNSERLIFNAKNNSFEHVDTTSVYDPAKTILVAFKNALLAVELCCKTGFILSDKI